MEVHMDDRKTLLERVVEATEGTVSRVQHEVSQSSVMLATRERASSARQRAQAAAINQLPLATRDDVERVQASLDRIEASLAELAKRLPEEKPARARAVRAKPTE
jgi:hypothetical protein